MKVFFFGLIFGIILHISLVEYANYNIVKRYKACLKPPEKMYFDCRHNFKPTTLENILLYQPELWNDFK
jgi:hypothetical protein